MLIAEYDYDTDIRVQREEAYEDGWDAGRRLANEELCRKDEMIRKLEEELKKRNQELNEMKTVSRIGE